MENSIFKKIFLQDNTPIRVLLTVLEKSLELFVLQKESAWKSIVNEDELNVFCVQLNVNVENYCENLMDYIRNLDSNSLFLVNDDEFVIKRFVSDALKMKVFSCKLQKINYFEQVEEIMEKFYNENVEMFAKLVSLEKERNESEKYKTSCETKLKELIQKKTEDENEQFGRFVLVLNEKKRRIQHLTELLEAFKNGRQSVTPTVKTKSRQKIKREAAPPVSKKETISDSESSDSYCTDNENDCNLQDDGNKPDASSQNIDAILDEDVAPSWELPKRLKGAPSTQTVTVSASQSSTSKKAEDVLKRKSPTVDISTQQLLDLL